MSYRCASCGELHDLPDLGADKPDYYWGVPEERNDRIDLTTDTCVIDNDDYFHSWNY